MFVPLLWFPFIHVCGCQFMDEQAEGTNERVPPPFQSYVPEGMLQNAIFSLIEGNITANVNRVHFITIFNLHFSGIISFAGFSIIHQRPTKRIGYFAQRSRLLFPPKEAATSAYDAVNK